MATELENRIAVVEERNKRVEADKAWETSFARRILIAVLTYVIVAIFLFLLDISRPWINAIIPAVGFLLSTLTITGVKKLWLKHLRSTDV